MTSEHRWDRQGEIGALPVFWREAPGPDGGRAPILYLHGVPTHSDDFLPFLERTGGVAPDLPGFGRSGKPAAFDYSISGYGRFLEAFLERVGLEGRFSLLVHDWGVVGLGLGPTVLERLERLVVINAVPLFADYRWHRLARLWRTPLVGEMTMGFTTRRGLTQVARAAFTAKGAPPDAFVDRVWNHFDHGTQRAILKLYRSAPSEDLGRAGGRLGDVRCPSLVVWGRRDPYIAASFADSFAGALGGPTEVELLDAGHWPWLDRPEAIDRVARFLT